MVGIVSFGAYVPRLRLERKAIAQAHAWLNPGLRGRAKGERALANWDEDAVTLSVEAARDCLDGFDRARIETLHAASTTFPFADRLNASIVASALGLPDTLRSSDATGSQRAGVTALLDALTTVKSGMAQAGLVTAGETRMARAASPQEMDYGDAAAALLVGAENPIARFVGAQTLTANFVDHFRGEGHRFDYHWEERWIRDEGYSKLVPRVVKALFEKTDVGADTITHMILPSPFPAIPPKIAGMVGIKPDAVRPNLAMECGEAGTAHALVMLAHALEDARPGERILVVQFAQGVTALLFEVTEAIASLPKRRAVTGSLARRKAETNYMKLLTFKNMLDWDKGMRAEKDNKTALTVLYRKDDVISGLVGGRCTVCGTAQYPRSRICVNPNCGAVDTQEPYSFADRPGSMLSWSADYLTYSMDPPQHYGMVTFEEGGRLMADLTDVDPGTVETGMAVRMVFRIKDFDETRGFRRYFWKAVPM